LSSDSEEFSLETSTEVNRFPVLEKLEKRLETAVISALASIQDTDVLSFT
jgi:hypothetical protein